ncbi:RHS repeat-associated core domain-containing protein [Flavobacterium eburneipallidum]|uniref:RHS repeat-associated core domain-containing protein n=1 Tax=Flavobacterium eburneipallidum TaxID=3003263 RepID=UPI002482392D|nr:RHS repeat-associated core domain-containing protein [Flavobacterium eburneipallidum]
MTVDRNKNITEIIYNHINLPTKITFGATGNIVYIYNAVGQKLEKQVIVNTPSSTILTNYLGGFQYQNNVLQFFPTVQGYVKNSSGVYSYVFNYKDHLGNTRISYQDINNDGTIANNEILEESNYYPFGLKHKGYNSNNAQLDYKYKYNGKELQDELELNLYDYGARNYAPALGSWMNVDPLAQKMPGVSPYTYCLNNPIVLTDPDGREPIKPQAGTSQGFVAFLNNTRSRMGTLTGNNAHNAMMRLGKTEMNWAHMRPEPMTTNPFNTSKDKYIYTERVGWLDMSHFMFYAGKAYESKTNKEAYQKTANDSNLSPSQRAQAQAKADNINPVGDAVQVGYQQEMSDRLVAGHSAYSYEDLPSDKWGADFGANYFNPNSEMTLGEQLQNYLNTMGATKPQNAPNYSTLPATDANLSEPTRTNHTTEGVYTKSNQ